MIRNEHFDFARNIREIEELKVGLLQAVSQVHEMMLDVPGGGEGLGEALSALISQARQLGGRVGLTQEDLERRVQARMRAGR